MSEIERLSPNGKVRWVARWNDGPRRAKVFDRKIDPQQFLAQTKVSLVAGNYVDPARGKINLFAMADKWLKTQNHLKPSTLARYRGIVEKRIGRGGAPRCWSRSRTRMWPNGSPQSGCPPRVCTTSTGCCR